MECRIYFREGSNTIVSDFKEVHHRGGVIKAEEFNKLSISNSTYTFVGSNSVKVNGSDILFVMTE